MQYDVSKKERKVMPMSALVDNYTKKELEQIVNSSNSMKEVIEKLGYKTCKGVNYKTVQKRLDLYGIICSFNDKPNKRIRRTKDNVFCNNSTVSQRTLRNWYIKINSDTICKICGQLNEWNNKPLVMILDHINGDNHDNRIQNLRWICPNCASQLSLYTGRNTKRRKDYIPINRRKNNKKICPICNINEINKVSSMCRECYRKKLSSQIPPKEELEKYIYTESFTKIGKRYGVSDNAVRKWCKKYKLQYRYGDLHKYLV